MGKGGFRFNVSGSRFKVHGSRLKVHGFRFRYCFGEAASLVGMTKEVSSLFSIFFFLKSKVALLILGYNRLPRRDNFLK